MKKFHIYSFIIFLLIASCCKEENSPFQVDENGVVFSMSHKWKYNLHTSGHIYENGYFDVPIVFNNNIAIPTTGSEGGQNITMIRITDGKFLWDWNDYFQESYGNLNIYHTFKNYNLLTWQVGNRSYCLNLDNGSTLWRIKRETQCAIRLHPYIGRQYFTTCVFSRNDGFDEYAAFVGDIETGELSEFLRANYSCEYAAPITENGSVGAIIYLTQVPTNANLLLVTYSEPLPEWKVRSMFGLYNTETKEWVYERKILADPLWNTSVFHTPIIFNGKIYANVGNNIVCHDVATGNQLWRREFTQDFFFSGFIIEDGMLIANCEDTYTYRLDPSTGATIWRTKGAGTSSRMSYLNGVVYFVGGSTGYLHAVEAASGRVLWRIDGRRLGGGPFTTNAVYCVPGEGGARGRVIALTNRYAYCFEAAL
jgi:outer membrane protein assembly factor BamB